MYAFCITGAFFANYDTNALFGGKVVFANNMAENGGTSVKSREPYCISGNTQNTVPRARMFRQSSVGEQNVNPRLHCPP